jgi:transcription antitermination factor NusG
MPKSWYAVHTIAGHENKVKDVLTRRAQVEGAWNLDIFEILIPTEREMQTRGGKRREVDRKVFPGYILVQMSMTDDMYKLVKSTSGVTGFVQSGNKPVPLEEYEVRRIMRVRRRQRLRGPRATRSGLLKDRSAISVERSKRSTQTARSSRFSSTSLVAILRSS